MKNNSESPQIATEPSISPRINFLELLVKEIPYDYKFKKYRSRKTPQEPLSFEIDDSHRFRNSIAYTKNGVSTMQSLSGSTRNTSMRDYIRKKQMEMKQVYNRTADDVLYPVDVVEWEKYVTCDEETEVATIEYVNGLLEENWEMNVSQKKGYMTLFVDDPNLIFEKVEKKNKKQKKGFKGVSDKPLKSKYNISNDKYYQAEAKNKASLGTFGVQHSIPALKLDEKLYKTNHSREELRTFHRPCLMLDEYEYVFKGVIANKIVANIKKGHEISLNDQSPFYIFEYFEEDPFFIVNPGMVSLLNRYYRKSDPNDHNSNENCIALEAEEEAPFLGFGGIKAGSYMQALTNNLYIAPVASHKSTDFLCIVSGHELFARPIESIFLVGQQLPKEEIFAPHSRKLNQFCKDRLKVAAYRIFSKNRDLLMQDLDRMFPYFSEGSKRKWLKEYADCTKKGRDNVWVLRDSCPLLGEEDLRKLVTPENICQYESMLAGERKMNDLGYKCIESEEDSDYGQFTPSWCLTRNFISASNGRGILQVNSKLNDIFNFKKIKMKKGNEAENRKILAEHQSTYKERIEKIWDSQIDFISTREYNYTINNNTEEKKESQSETTAIEDNCLIIKRYINGSVTIEKVYDPRVIKAYLKARKKSKPEDKKTSLTCSNCGQSGHMKTNKSCPNFVSLNRNSKKKYENEKRRARIYLQDVMNKLLSGFIATPFSNAFHRPVSLKKFPNYELIVKNPIDFSSIRLNIRNFKYKKFDAFVAEFKLMLNNCILYNGPLHSLTEIAENIFNQVIIFQQEHAWQIKDAENMIEMDESV